MADRSTGDTSLPPRAAEFLELRPLLFAIAYRVLGRVTEAEDVVQDTWLHYQDVTEQPRSPKAYLSTVVTRLSINVLSSARMRREEYIGERSEERRVGKRVDVGGGRRDACDTLKAGMCA